MEPTSWLDHDLRPTRGPRRPDASPTEGVLGRVDRVERWRSRLADTPASLESDVRTGLGLDEFTLEYQPRHELARGRVTAVEALLRWRRGHRSHMSPEVYLGALSDASVMDQLGRWVLHNALLQVARWEQNRPADVPAIGISVNVTPAEVVGDGFIDRVALALVAADVAPELVQLEVAARSAGVIDATVVERLRALATLGVGFALDGVDPSYGRDGLLVAGGGVNISRQWIRVVASDPRAATAIAELISRVHDAGLTVCAIGVETRAQAAVLTEMGCDHAQGFLFSEPVPPSELGWQADERQGGGLASAAPPTASPLGPSGLPERRGTPRRRPS